jgi:hypothetical protein
MKVGVSGTDFDDAVFKHKGGRVKVVYRISGEARMLSHKVGQHIGVSLRFAEHLAVSATTELSNPIARLRKGERTRKHASMGAHTQEFVHNPPGQKPQFPASTVAFKCHACPFVFRCIWVARVEQEIGVDDKHVLDAFHRAIQSVAISEVYQGCAHGVHGQWREVTRIGLPFLEAPAEYLLNDRRELLTPPSRPSLEFAKNLIGDNQRSLHRKNLTR